MASNPISRPGCRNCNRPAGLSAEGARNAENSARGTKIPRPDPARSCAVFVAVSCSGRENPGAGRSTRPAGTLVVSYRNEPRSFNRYAVPQSATELFTRLTQAPLVRLNRATRQPEPWLAAGVERCRGREDVDADACATASSFSDGAPFTAADVLFSFQAIYDAKVDSPLGTSVRAGGEPLTVRALDERTVVITLAAPAGAGVALLDTLPIYPRHKLKAALDAGTFRDAWATNAPLTDLAGLGPYVLKEHVAGQRLVFARNPHYWRKDETGRALPYLDGIEVQIIPDANGEMLRLQAGALDLVTDYARAEDLAALRTLASAGKIALMDPGISVAPEFLLDQPAARRRGREGPRRGSSATSCAQAISAGGGSAGDRQHGLSRRRRAGVGPDHAGARPLVRARAAERHARSRPRRRAARSRSGSPTRTATARATTRAAGRRGSRILTQKGHTVRERMAAVIQEQLRQVGLTIDVVPVDVATLNQAHSRRATSTRSCAACSTTPSSRPTTSG